MSLWTPASAQAKAQARAAWTRQEGGRVGLQVERSLRGAVPVSISPDTHMQSRVNMLCS